MNADRGLCKNDDFNFILSCPVYIFHNIIMQQQLATHHRYINIGPDANESALVTSHFSLDHDSPKSQHMEFSHTARTNEETK